jgi:hypothetical protein
MGVLTTPLGVDPRRVAVLCVDGSTEGPAEMSAAGAVNTQRSLGEWYSELAEKRAGAKCVDLQAVQDGAECRCAELLPGGTH